MDLLTQRRASGTLLPLCKGELHLRTQGKPAFDVFLFLTALSASMAGPFFPEKFTGDSWVEGSEFCRNDCIHLQSLLTDKTRSAPHDQQAARLGWSYQEEDRALENVSRDLSLPFHPCLRLVMRLSGMPSALQLRKPRRREAMTYSRSQSCNANMWRREPLFVPSPGSLPRTG